MERRYYYGIDWIRVLACVGIVLMHIQANTDYCVSGVIFEIIIPSFTDCVFLFMTVSAFVLCCKYHEQTINGKMNIIEFYRKRWIKIFPFFV